jgi:hypothetical protein
MKKTLFLAAILFMALASRQQLHAQYTHTADLELIFRDTTRHFVIEPYDSVDVNFAVVNHGPDDIDTSNFVLYSMTFIPANYFLVVQSDNGSLMPIPSGDTVLSSGLRFLNTEPDTVEKTTEYCYFLRTTEDADSFINDANQLNDTICFSITYKKINPPTGIAGAEAQLAPLKIMPNPASDKVNIPIREFMNKETMLRIYSIDGRTAYQLKLTPPIDKMQVDVRSWPKGIYLVDIQSGTLKRRGKFVVQ